FPFPAASCPVGERSLGDNDDRAPSRIRRSDCNRLFRISANLNQSTTNPANGAKNGKSRSTGETAGLSAVGLFRAYRCRSFCFHVCLVGSNVQEERYGQFAHPCRRDHKPPATDRSPHLDIRSLLRPCPWLRRFRGVPQLRRIPVRDLSAAWN